MEADNSNVEQDQETSPTEEIKEFSSEQRYGSSQHLCSLCSKMPATMVCQTEKMFLCNGCGKHHKSHELTKYHAIQGLIDYLESHSKPTITPQEFTCEICEKQNEKSPGYGFCKVCPVPEVLCLRCSKSHVSSKLYKGHTFNTNLNEFMESKKFLGRTHSSENNEYVCEICKTQGMNVTGFGFCEDCLHPEILCIECAKRHIASKLGHGHNINTNLPEKSETLSELKKIEIPCEICKSQDQKVPGYGFCEDCSEPEILCKDCSNRHIASKLGQGHKINLDLAVILKIGTTPLCEICQTQDQVVPGYGFCEDCAYSEILCKDCSSRHIASKLGHGHRINSNLDKFPYSECNSVIVFCELCQSQNKQVPAYGFCEDCPEQEMLCTGCSNRHRASKLGQGHAFNTQISKFQQPKMSNFFPGISAANLKRSEDALYHSCSSLRSDDSFIDNLGFNKHKNKSENHFNTEKKEKICSLCAETEKKESPASLFCKSCPVPEPLCFTCAHHHSKQKYSRDHELCDNLDELQEHIEQNCILCSQCSYERKKTIAVSFCSTCESKDPFCDQCAEKHTRLKEFSDHNICQDIQNIPGVEKIPCEQCHFRGENRVASCFCSDCLKPMPLCDSCGEIHTRTRQYGNHNIVYDLARFLKRKFLEEEMFCYMCEFEGKQVHAISRCLQCDELMCNICVKEHNKHTNGEHSFSEIPGVLPTTSSLTKPLSKSTIHYETLNKQNKSKIRSESLQSCSTESISDLNAAKHADGHYLENEETKMVVLAKQSVRKDKMSGSTSPLYPFDQNQQPSTDKIRKPKIKTRSNVLHGSSTTLSGSEENSGRMTFGKPIKDRSRFDAIDIKWNDPQEKVNYSIVFYKRKTDDDWEEYKKQWKSNYATIDGLESDTSYQFKICCVKGKKKGIFIFSEISDVIKTDKSLAEKLKRLSNQKKKGNPSIYKLPTKETRRARNEEKRTREIIIGEPYDVPVEKTLMLVGVTGSGKSTLVDGLINYVLGVQFHDNCRFTVEELEEDEQKTQDQALSQTEWVTVYKIYPQQYSRLGFMLNIIDTPGFGDTRGIERDNMIINQIRHLFSTKGESSVKILDTVCFIAKAPDMRLTAVQTYIFHQILSLFGKDMKDNFCNFITFADEHCPPVLSALKSAKLPAREWFKFNNSGLFASNTSDASKPSWDMGYHSFDRFFKSLDHFQGKSLTQTKEVLQKREHLQTILSNLQPQIRAGLTKINELGEQISLYEKHKNDVENNTDFMYEAKTVKQIQIDLPIGIHVTNCLQCNITCHDNCIFADDADKKRCSAMSQKGLCKVCPKKCKWNEHRNARYKFTYETVIETRTYDDMKRKYEEASGKKLSYEKYLLELQKDVEVLFSNVKDMMDDMNQCKNELKKIALRPDPLSTVEHINQMIEAENIEKNAGYESRIKMLQEYRNMAETHKNVEKIGLRLDGIKDQIQSVTNSESCEPKGIWNSIKSSFGLSDG